MTYDAKQVFRMALKKSPCIKVTNDMNNENDWRTFRIIRKCHHDYLHRETDKGGMFLDSVKCQGNNALYQAELTSKQCTFEVKEENDARRTSNNPKKCMSTEFTAENNLINGLESVLYNKKNCFETLPPEYTRNSRPFPNHQGSSYDFYYPSMNSRLNVQSDYLNHKNQAFESNPANMSYSWLQSSVDQENCQASSIFPESFSSFFQSQDNEMFPRDLPVGNSLPMTNACNMPTPLVNESCAKPSSGYVSEDMNSPSPCYSTSSISTPNSIENMSLRINALHSPSSFYSSPAISTPGSVENEIARFEALNSPRLSYSPSSNSTSGPMENGTYRLSALQSPHLTYSNPNTSTQEHIENGIIRYNMANSPASLYPTSTISNFQMSENRQERLDSSLNTTQQINSNSSSNLSKDVKINTTISTFSPYSEGFTPIKFSRHFANERKSLNRNPKNGSKLIGFTSQPQTFHSEYNYFNSTCSMKGQDLSHSILPFSTEISTMS